MLKLYSLNDMQKIPKLIRQGIKPASNAFWLIIYIWAYAYEND